MRTSFTVAGVQQTIEGSSLISALSTTWDDGDDIAIERSHKFEDDGGEAIVEAETFYYDSVRVGSDETNDWLVGCSRANPVVHAAGTFVQAGTDAEIKKVATGYFEDENDKHRVEIRENVAKDWPLGAYTEDQYRATEVESDDEGFAEVVTAPLSEPWAIENVVDGQAGPTYGQPYRYKLDETGFFVWDEDGTPLIALDAANLSHLLVGTIKNALTGTRWEISSAFANYIKGFVAGMDNPAFLSAYSAGGVNGLQLRPGYTSGTQPVWEITQNPNEIVHSAAETKLHSGVQARGFCAWRQPAGEVLATQSRGYGVMYGGVSRTENTPSGITFTTVGTDSNVASVAAADITNRGFRLVVTASATGTALEANRTFVTTGA